MYITGGMTSLAYLRIMGNKKKKKKNSVVIHRKIGFEKIVKVRASLQARDALYT